MSEALTPHPKPEVFYLTLGDPDLKVELVQKTDYDALEEQLEALQAERDRLREGVTDAADILDVIGKWFSAGADTNNMEPILDNALPLMAKWEEKLAAISYPAREPS